MRAAQHLLVSGGMPSLVPHHVRALANAASSLARCEVDPGAAWISHFLQVTRLAMPSFCAVDLAAIAWALAKWGFQPAPFWLEAFYTRLQEVSSQLSCQGMCNVVWAMAILQLQPPSQLLNTLMFEAQVRIPYFTGHGLGTLVWALRTLEAQPPNFWITAMLQVAPGLLAGVSKDARGQPFVNIAWAVSCWQRVIPPSPWMQGFFRVSSAHLPTMSSRSLAVLMLAVADLEHQPPEAWTSLALESFHRQGLDPEQVDTPTLVSFTWALSRLMTQPRGAPSPSPTTLQLALQGTTGRPSAAQRLAPFPADQLSPDREAEGQELGGREGTDPGLGGGQGGWDGGEEGEGEVGQEGAKHKGRGLQQRWVAPGRTPPAKWWLAYYTPLLQDLVVALEQRLRGMAALDLVDVVVALADLHHSPGSAWLDLHAACCSSCLHDFTAYQLNLMSKASQRLRRMPRVTARATRTPTHRRSDSRRV
ncbi:hypothetical protein QJQ45_022212 [Haematococcus lacustris]|nr:hypothetical protein QJQ45_022212 [Haematococcus lacustris]